MLLQLPEGLRQVQERGTVAQRSWLALNHSQIVPPVIDRATGAVMRSIGSRPRSSLGIVPMTRAAGSPPSRALVQSPRRLLPLLCPMHPCARVALVGSSGAGKTTIANLMLRFWDSKQGSVAINGHDLRDITLDSLREQIALVAQDTYLFNATLAENILLARPDASPDDLHLAMQRAALADFVASLPDGLETKVGERGVQLSGGQRQRISIARAFLKNAPILILDEATSHLDAASELHVRKALDELMVDRTTIIIAHRLSTIRSSDQILVMREGRIVERGTHRDLMSLGGFYAELIGHQSVGRTLT